MLTTPQLLCRHVAMQVHNRPLWASLLHKMASTVCAAQYRTRATDLPPKWHLLAQTVLAILCNSKLMPTEAFCGFAVVPSQHALVMG